jgi:hypothetical protein
MRNIQSESLARLLAAEEVLRTNDPFINPMAVSTPVWNRMMDRWSRALADVVQDAELMAELRRTVPTVVEPRDRRLLAQVLLVPLNELAPEPAAILADPRVALTADQVEIAPAIYLADREWDPRWDSIDDGDGVEPGEPFHDLTRMGGLPTAGPWDQPDDPFILQIDLSSPAQSDDVRALAAEALLPADGLLQLFHTTMGDSRTDPHLAGGGATLLYISEPALTQRHRSDREELFSGRLIRMRVLPAFRFGTAADSDETFLEVIALQQRADAIARVGTQVDSDAYDATLDPFDEIVPGVSRLLGIQHFDSDDSDETRDTLARDLPLVTPDDRHLLLFDISSDTILEDVFGADGRLEIWIRASDVTAQDFSHVVSFIRST